MYQEYINYFLEIYNTIQSYYYMKSVIIFILLIIGLKIFQKVILRYLRKLALKTTTDFDDLLVNVFTGISTTFYLVVSLYIASKPLLLNHVINDIIKVAFLLVIINEIIRAIIKFVRYFFDKYIVASAKKNQNKEHLESMSNMMISAGVITLWIIGLTIVLATMGVNVTSIVASMGIGGVAIALALQNILGDIFSSLSIYLDKPFQIGDYIVIGENMGTVEKIGLKTTRLRSTQGEELVVSNKELTSVRLQNYGKVKKRRELLLLEVIYETEQKKLEKIPVIIKDILTKIPNVTFDRCHLMNLGNSGIRFDTVFYVSTKDYGAYVDIKQKINLLILQDFKKQKIDFAYPTQTIFVKK